MKTFKYVEKTFLGRRLSNLVKSSLKPDDMWVTKYIYICDVQDCKQLSLCHNFLSFISVKQLLSP